MDKIWYRNPSKSTQNRQKSNAKKMLNKHDYEYKH